MPLTDKSSDCTQALVDILDASKVTLGVTKVYYGDQELIPDYPAITVESSVKRREHARTQQFNIRPSSIIMVYFGKVQSSEINVKANDQLCEAIEGVVHQAYTLNGLVVFGFITRVDPGVAIKSGVMVKASRMTWEGLSQAQF